MVELVGLTCWPEYELTVDEMTVDNLSAVEITVDELTQYRREQYISNFP